MMEPDAVALAPCPHTLTTQRVVRAEFFKREFLAEVNECQACGLQSWTPDTHARFQQWMVVLKHEKRDLFQIQFYMPVTVRQKMREFLRPFPSVPMSSLIRATTAVHLAALIRAPEFAAVSRRVFESESYRQVTAGERRKTSLQFSPMAMLDIHTWAPHLRMTPPKVVEDALYKFLALQSEADPQLRGFWEHNLRPQVELVLRSV